MRDEKEERKKQARSNKQTRQSNTAHPRQSLFLEKNELPQVGLEPTTLYTLDRACTCLNEMKKEASKVKQTCMWVRVPPEAAHFSQEKLLPWVCCVALHCCLFDLACFFLPSFSSLIKTCTIPTYTLQHENIFSPQVSILLATSKRN